jgi:hypothetical protein
MKNNQKGYHRNPSESKQPIAGVGKMKQYIRLFIDLYEKTPNFICILSAVFVLSIDFVTGENIHFPIFYAIPAGLAAWQLNVTLAYTISITLPLLRVGFFYLWNNNHFDFISLINAFIIIIALSAYVYLTTMVVLEKRDLEEQLKRFKEQ